MHEVKEVILLTLMMRNWDTSFLFVTKVILRNHGCVLCGFPRQYICQMFYIFLFTFLFSRFDTTFLLKSTKSVLNFSFLKSRKSYSLALHIVTTWVVGTKSKIFTSQVCFPPAQKRSCRWRGSPRPKETRALLRRAGRRCGCCQTCPASPSAACRSSQRRQRCTAGWSWTPAPHLSSFYLWSWCWVTGQKIRWL